MIFKYREAQFNTIGTVSPCYEIIEFFPLVIMMLSLPPFWFHCKVICLPDFEPTEYLFEKHASKGETRWEIYAWAVRDIMIQQGDLKESNMAWKNKDQYEKYMQMAKNAQIPEFAPGGVPIALPAISISK